MIISSVDYLKNYNGKADTIAVTANEQGCVPKYTECRFVQISNFNVENETARPYSIPPPGETENTSGFEIYFGFNGTITRQLFIGQTSEIIPIANLNQLIIQSRPGTTRTVWLTYFW